MSGYNMEHFLSDFADRTVINLRYIDDKAKQDKLFEVTQLINSLLGLIIIPVEYSKKSKGINDQTFIDASSKDYNAIAEIIKQCKDEKRYYSDYEKDSNNRGKIYVSNFINHIRNAIAHGGNNGIHFFPISEGKTITDIIFYDNNKVLAKQNGYSNEINEFCIKLSLPELKKLVNAISCLYCKFDEKNENVLEKQDKYYSDIGKLEGLLKKGRLDYTKVVFEFEERENL